MSEGRYEDALEYFRRAQALPENLNVGFWNESVLIPYRYNEALALKALGKTDEAEKIAKELSTLKDVGMWNMGGEFVYYSALSVRLGGEDMRANKIMRDAVLLWEAELKGGCKHYKEGTRLFGCFVGDHVKIRLATLYGMLGYGKLFSGDTEGAKELFSLSVKMRPTFKIAFELELLK